MSQTIVSYAHVGFQVQESDFWTVVPARVETCENGHQRVVGGPFCPEDGTSFKLRHGREASAKFVALAKHFGWDAKASGLYGWLQEYDRIYALLRKDDGYNEKVGLYSVDRHRPVHEGSSLLAIAKPVVHIEGWTKGKPPLTRALGLGDLGPVFAELEAAKKAGSFETPVMLYFSLYVS